MHPLLASPLVACAPEDLLSRAQVALKSLDELGIPPQTVIYDDTLLSVIGEKTQSGKSFYISVEPCLMSVSLVDPDGGYQQFIVNETAMTRSMERVRLHMNP